MHSKQILFYSVTIEYSIICKDNYRYYMCTIFINLRGDTTIVLPLLFFVKLAFFQKQNVQYLSLFYIKKYLAWIKFYTVQYYSKHFTSHFIPYKKWTITGSKLLNFSPFFPLLTSLITRSPRVSIIFYWNT